MTATRPVVVYSCFVAILISTSIPALAQTLEAGVARADITPQPGLPLQGYGSGGRTATGVRDPLYARVLVLGAGGERMALVDLDLIAPFGQDYLAQLQTAVNSDAQHLLVAAIHTHSGPALIPTPASPPNAWETEAVAKVANAIHQAATHMTAAQLGVGYGVSYVGHNRLLRHRNGTVTWFEPNWTGIATAPFDPTVAIVRIDDRSGNPLAILLNYACHPVIFGPDSRLYSADFPAVTTAVVEKELGGKPLCFFLQGGDGDINPNYALTSLEDGAEALRERTGTELGQVAARIARQTQTAVDPKASLHFAEDKINFQPRWDRLQWSAANPEDAANIALQTKPNYELEVTTALIDDKIAVLAMPGEPFVDFQRQWRAACPVRDCLFLGYANGYFGYFPTISAATWGGYGASSDSTWLEVGAGERMLDAGLARVYQMLGRLKSMPEDLRQ